MNDVKIVLLDCPYATFTEQITQEYFGKSIGLRIKGYKARYGKGVFPLDITDYVSAHILICVPEGNGIRPVSTVKIVLLSRCEQFNVPFPAIGVAQATESAAQVGFIKESITEAKSANADLSYLTSWTVDPDLPRINRALAANIKELLIATIVNYHWLHGITRGLVAGNVRYKTDKMSESWGYRYGTYQGKPLPQFNAAFLFGVPAYFMRLEEFSEYAVGVAEKFSTLWANRLEIAEIEDAEVSKAA